MKENTRFCNTLQVYEELDAEYRKEKQKKLERKSHREICSLCHEVNRVGFWVPDTIWSLATHQFHRQSIICLQCFTRLADERGVQWDKEIKFYPVSWITHIEE